VKNRFSFPCPFDANYPVVDDDVYLSRNRVVMKIVSDEIDVFRSKVVCRTPDRYGVLCHRLSLDESRKKGEQDSPGGHITEPQGKVICSSWSLKIHPHRSCQGVVVPGTFFLKKAEEAARQPRMVRGFFCPSSAAGVFLWAAVRSYYETHRRLPSWEPRCCSAGQPCGSHRGRSAAGP
jgi:hypothetical protein